MKRKKGPWLGEKSGNMFFAACTNFRNEEATPRRPEFNVGIRHFDRQGHGPFLRGTPQGIVSRRQQCPLWQGVLPALQFVRHLCRGTGNPRGARRCVSDDLWKEVRGLHESIVVKYQVLAQFDHERYVAKLQSRVSGLADAIQIRTIRV